jgi:hypothetical protein
MPERSRIVKGDLDAVSDDALVEHAYLVSRGVRPMALAGYTSSGDWEMTRPTTRLERLASPGAITFVIPRDDGLADCGYGACRWAIDLYGWALVSRRDAMPARYRHRIVGLLLGYSPMAIRDFEAANGLLAPYRVGRISVQLTERLHPEHGGKVSLWLSAISRCPQSLRQTPDCGQGCPVEPVIVNTP